MIALAFPEFSKPGPRWGYTWNQLLQGLHESIEILLREEAQNKKFVLISHDWGAYLAQIYQNQHPERVSKLVCLDVGMMRPKLNLGMFIILFYQWWFAFAYFLSQALHPFFGNLWLFLFFGTPVNKLLGPCPHDRGGRRAREITVQMTYVYYHFWRSQFLCGRDGVPAARFPIDCPVLFLYGTKKRTMFHDAGYLAKIDKTPGCRWKAMNTGIELYQINFARFILRYECILLCFS